MGTRLLIIVADDAVLRHLEAEAIRRGARTFDSLEAHRRWAAADAAGRDTITDDVATIRARVGLGSSIHRDLEALLASVSTASSAPETARELAGSLPLRTFYRLWAKHSNVTPAMFLMLVRLNHAQRLSRSAVAPKLAAAMAGFPSPRAWRRARVRYGGQLGTLLAHPGTESEHERK